LYPMIALDARSEVMDLTDDSPAQRPRKRARSSQDAPLRAAGPVEIVELDDLCSLDSEVQLFEPAADELDEALSMPAGGDPAAGSDHDSDMQITGKQ